MSIYNDIFSFIITLDYFMLIPPKKQSNFKSVLNFFLQVWGTVFASKPGSHAEYTVATEKEVMIKLKLLVAIYSGWTTYVIHPGIFLSKTL